MQPGKCKCYNRRVQSYRVGSSRSTVLHFSADIYWFFRIELFFAPDTFLMTLHHSNSVGKHLDVSLRIMPSFNLKHNLSSYFTKMMVITIRVIIRSYIKKNVSYGTLPCSGVGCFFVRSLTSLAVMCSLV